MPRCSPLLPLLLAGCSAQPAPVADGPPADAAVRPALTADDPSAAAANRAALQAALDAARPGQTVQLPAGTLWFDTAPVVRSDTTLRGAGPQTILRSESRGTYPLNCTLVVADPGAASYADHLALTDGNPAVGVPGAGSRDFYRPGAVAYLFPFQYGRTRLPNQRFRVTGRGGNRATFDAPVRAGNAGLVGKVFPRAATVKGAVTSGQGGCDLDDPAQAALFKPGDAAFVTDGAAINEAHGSWVVVRSSDPRTGAVQFERPVRRSLAAGLTTLVAGPWTTGVTVRDLTVGPNRPGNTTLFAKWCVDLTIQDVTVAGPGCGEVMVCQCYRPRVIDCNVKDGSLRVSTCEAAEVSGGFYATLSGEEYGLACRYHDLTCGGFGFNIVAEDYAFDRVTFDRAAGVEVYRGFRLTDCRQTNTPPGAGCYVRGSDVVIRRLQSDAGWWVQPASVGEGMEGEPKGPQNVQILDSRFAGLLLGPGTSGVVTGCQGPVTDQSGGGWKVAPATGGAGK